MIHLNYLAFALPAFFLFVALEYAGAVYKKKKHIFNYDSSIANLSIGIAERLLNLFVSASFYQLFYFVYENYAIFTIPNNWIVWVAIILATDMIWYWYHRLGHEINLFWAAHIVHHQSEEFNYTASARITTFQALIRNIFWCILPLLGFHPAMVITILLVHGAYSFFTHTQMIGKLGWLEYIFITPSLHGVHHASDEKYLNKNYGDVFVFWDKLFGTFQREEEHPQYGLTHPLNNYSFMWQHFHYFMEIAEMCKQTSGFKNKLKVIFGRPEDMDQNIRPLLEEKYFPDKYRVKPTLRFKAYLAFQIVLSASILFVLTLLFSNIQIVDRYFALIFILLTLINCGALLEQRRWIHYLEYTRLLILFGYLSYVFVMPGLLLTAILVIILLDLTYPVQKWYLRLVFNTDRD